MPRRSQRRSYSWRLDWPTWAGCMCACMSTCSGACVCELLSDPPPPPPLFLFRSLCQNTRTNGKTSAPCITASPSGSYSTLLLMWELQTHAETHRNCIYMHECARAVYGKSDRKIKNLKRSWGFKAVCWEGECVVRMSEQWSAPHTHARTSTHRRTRTDTGV